MIKVTEKNKQILRNSLLHNIIENFTSIMVAKNSLKVIVANPAADSCLVIGDVLIDISDDLNSIS